MKQVLMQMYLKKYNLQTSSKCINLRLNSYGGSLFAGLATVDVIRNLNCEVHSHVEGAAASAATIISVACDKRYIGKYSKMLIHQLSSGTYGKYNELEDDMENNNNY